MPDLPTQGYWLPVMLVGVLGRPGYISQAGSSNTQRVRIVTGIVYDMQPHCSRSVHSYADLLWSWF